MIILAWVLGFFTTYLLIGWAWCSWICYRSGAGFKMPNDDGFDAPLRYKGIHIWLWFVSVGIYVYHLPLKSSLTPRFLYKLTPTAFYERGKIDNDVDHQAEQHLLREKT